MPCHNSSIFSKILRHVEKVEGVTKKSNHFYLFFSFPDDNDSAEEHSDREKSPSPEPRHHQEDRPSALNLVSLIK